MTYVAEQQDQRTSSTHDLPSPRWNEAVTDALNLLRAPLATFVRQQMQQEYGDGWVNCALGALHSATGSRHSRPQDLDHDLSAMLHTVINFWQMAFRRASPRFMCGRTLKRSADARRKAQFGDIERICGPTSRRFQS